MADDILIVGYDADGRNHSRTLRQVMQNFHCKNLNQSKINAISGAPEYHLGR